MDRVARVFYQGRLAGLLSQTEHGFTFRYDKQYLKEGPAIAYTLPLSHQDFESVDLHPCFENLLAEGWMLGVQSQVERIDPSDRFGLLVANGLDLVGAITVEAENEL